MAGLIPAPGTVGYGAAKHAVVGLSRALRIEAAALGIRVSVLCPGPVRTPILDGGKYGKMLRHFPPEFQRRMWKRLKPMDPDRFADQVLADVAANRALIIVPARWKLLWWIDRLSPALGEALIRRFYQSQVRALDRFLAANNED